MVLVDQDDGEYVGMLGNDINVSEDPGIVDVGKEPVIADISEDGKSVRVRPARIEEDDFLLRSASLIRSVMSPITSYALINDHILF